MMVSVTSRNRLILVLSLAVTVVPWTLEAQDSAARILKQIREGFDKVRDYSADISAVVDVPNVKLPKMEARIYFKRPDRVHVESEGFALLPRDVVGFNPASFDAEHYDAVVQGSEKVGEIVCTRVKLLAKSDTMRLQRVMLFVDPTRWLVLRMTTDPSQGGAAEVTIEYTLVDGLYHLPSKVAVEMTAPRFRRTRPGNDSHDETKKEKATAVVWYDNYRVNKGISDTIFKEKP